MFKRVFLFLLTNIAVIVVLSIAIALIESFFGINISAHGGGYLGLLIFASIFGFTGAFISLAMSKWMAKRAYKITLITEENESKLDDKERVVYNTVLSLAKENGIKIPEIGIYEDNEPNAFATGATKNSSLVAVSTGLLTNMDKNAIEGVVGHEMAHVLNGDMVTMTLLQGILNTFVIFFARIIANIFNNVTDGKFGMLGYYGVVILFEIIFGILASMIAMWFSRYREYRADAGSARFVGKDKMIAGLEALKKIQSMASSDSSKLATMKISTKKRGGIMKLFSSHPDLDDRIKALEDIRL